MVWPPVTPPIQTDANTVVTSNAGSNSIHQALCNNINSDPPEAQTDDIHQNGHVYCHVAMMANIQYHVNNDDLAQTCPGSPIDNGTNGGIAGADFHVIKTSNCLCDVTGLGDAKVNNLCMGTCAAKTSVKFDATSLAFSTNMQFMDMESLSMIPINTMLFGNKVDDFSKPLGGEQQDILTDGTIVPSFVHSSSTYMKTPYPTDDNMDAYPHIIFTSNEPWDPTVYYHPSDFDEDPLNCKTDLSTPEVTRYGENIVDLCACICYKSHVANQHPDIDQLHPYLRWTPFEHVKHTLDATT